MVGMEYFDVLIKPQPTMEAEKKNANTMSAVRTFALFGIILGLLQAVSLFMSGVANGFLGGLGVAIFVVVPIVSAIFVVIFSMIGIGIVWILARLLGGKGSFAENYYLYSLIAFPLLAIYVVFFVVGLIPILGAIVVGLASLVLSLYMLYVSVVLISVANQISKLRALAVLVILGIIYFIVMIILVATAIAGLITWLYGMGSQAAIQ